MWKRLPALAAALTVLFSLMVPFAGAADYTGDGYVNYTVWDTGAATGSSIDDSISSVMPMMDLYKELPYLGSSDSLTNRYLRFRSAQIGTWDTLFSGPVKLYLSYFLYLDSASDVVTSFGYYNVPVEGQYYNSDTQVVGTSSDVNVTLFNPNFPTEVVSKGNLIEVGFMGSTESPIMLPTIKWKYDSTYLYSYNWKHSTSVSDRPSLRILSFRAVTTQTTAEMESLEEIADAIVAQNEIMTAYYGDIVSICNQIYSRLGDIQGTLETANIYFDAMADLLKNIDSTTVDIYNLLAAQLAALESAIKNGASDVVAAISAQTAALIAYFNELYGVDQVPGSVQDQVNEGASIQQDLDQLKKPDAVTIVPDISGIISDSDVSSYGGILGSVFNVGIVVSMLMISLSLAFVGYVLYGKR